MKEFIQDDNNKHKNRLLCRYVLYMAIWRIIPLLKRLTEIDKFVINKSKRVSNTHKPATMPASEMIKTLCALHLQCWSAIRKIIQTL